uniref:LOW QUALITY PROTEIN: armadillo repeat-containing protein 3 n=1 Tax=Gasterosteus aculeatus aculeatus TaxID=481459 RepID=UPI001A98C4A5|nr:LOW QUALITY PROTEIN: armadillo repeat-containing protein 3 [Gasterosteus aculeatus aculeatus]
MGKKGKKGSETPCAETFEPLPFEGKTPATIVLLLRSLEEDILAKACEAIHIFAEKGDENKVSLVGLGALEPLCQLITHMNRLVRRNAFMALSIMASNDVVRVALKKIDVIPSIIDKLSPEEDIVVHEFATLCLASLSVDFVCKAQIFDHKGLPPLIRLLSSPDPDVMKNSLETIFHLVQDYQSRLAVHELGGIPPLLDLLKSDFPVIQHVALKTLQNVTVDKESSNTLREEQGFEKLMDILSNTKFNDLHAEALPVVLNCINDSESLQVIHRGGGLMRLMEFVLTRNMPEIQSNAVRCITRAAQSSENRKLLHEQNVEKVLVELLSVGDVSVNTAACGAVFAMSFHLASKDSFRDLCGIPEVVRLLSNDSLALREAATEALSTLTHGNQLNAFAVYEAGGGEILVQQLYGSCPSTVANSAATLGNMAGQEVVRCSVLSHGAIRALVENLKSTDTQVLVNATRCVAVLAHEKEARAELLRAGGLQPLVNLLRTDQKEVLHNACLAINVCSSDLPAAVEMCKFGALERLQQINQSATRGSSFSRLARISLLNSNLSVKYSLTGHLAVTDLISDGFYDAGKPPAGQSILTLKELSEQPVNEQRPIIVINTAKAVTLDVREVRNSNQSEPDTCSKGGSRTTRPIYLQHRKKKEDNKQKEEDQTETPKGKPWKMMDDVFLQVLLKEAKESIIPLSDEREQCAALARLVSEAMGGAVEMEKLHEVPWLLHLSELKFLLQSNVVPIGLINRGIYCHRALLFKCLADRIGMSCTLVRGEYNRAWNEVLLFNGNPSRNQHSSKPCRYIVDLMHQPGSLLKPAPLLLCIPDFRRDYALGINVEIHHAVTRQFYRDSSRII